MSGGAHQTSQTTSTRIRNCSNNTNIDTIQCDSYAPKLRQRPAPMGSGAGPPPKSVHTKPSNRDRSTSRSRCVPSVVSNLASCARSPTLIGNRIRRENSVNSVIRKEVYTSADNPALVEVTVKTHGNGQQQGRPAKQPLIRNHGESWSKILQQNSVLCSALSEGSSSFSNFDPLRTVHFLAKELQSKLQENLSDDDNNIQQIICDMQQALNRVPPEVASTLGLSISPQYILNQLPNSTTNYDYPTKDDMRQERLLGVIKSSSTAYSTVERGCQTAKCRNMVLEPEKFQQHLEDSTAKIESACRQMEVVCSKLKTDKEELERELLAERETVQQMRAQLEQSANGLHQLETERNTLQRDLKQLKAQLITGTTSQGHVLQELQVQKISADDQLATYRQQLTIAKMETEKYVAILAARDKQVTEIRSEMNQLQELVIEQLREIQTAPCTSSATSCTTNETSRQSLLWIPVNKTANISGDNNKKTGFEREVVTDRDIYKEIADAMANMGDVGGSTTCGNGGDTTATSVVSSTTTIDATKKSSTSKMVASVATTELRQSGAATADTSNSADVISSSNNGTNPTAVLLSSGSIEPRKVSIRDMFADIKKQALLINAHQLTVQHEPRHHHRAT